MISQTLFAAKTEVFTIHLLPESGERAASSIFFAHADFFLFFPPMRSLVPGYVYFSTLNI